MRDQNNELGRVESQGRPQSVGLLRAGMCVVIAAGPLQGLRGTILCLAADDWPVVLVSLYRGWTPLELPPWWVYSDEGACQLPAATVH